MVREGTDPLRLSHWNFLSSDLLLLSVQSCLVVKISGFVFFYLFTTVLRLVNSACVRPGTVLFVLFWSEWPFLNFWEIFQFQSKIWKFKILGYSYPHFYNEFEDYVANAYFHSRRRVRLCPSEGMAHTPLDSPLQFPHWTHYSGLYSRGDPVFCNQFTNLLRNCNLFTSPQLAVCHKRHHTTIHCLLTFSQNLHYVECSR